MERLVYKCQYTLNTCLIHHNNNNNECNCYVVECPGLAQIASHKKELIDNELIIVHAYVCEKLKKVLN